MALDVSLSRAARTVVALLLLGCPGGHVDDATSEVEASSSTTADSSSSTSEGSSSSATTTIGEGTMSEGGGAVCGDGIVEGAEACDDGNSRDDDACLSNCELARCGDGALQVGVEACDDGNEVDEDDCVGCALASCGDGFVLAGVEECDAGRANAWGVYDGCTPWCTRGPRCGDGVVQGDESCDDGDDGDNTDGCVDGCVKPISCKHVKDVAPGANTGTYLIFPWGDPEPTPVWCEMVADGGGYTFFKVDVEKDQSSPPLTLLLAEAECQKYGLHLLTTRSPAHAAAAYAFATSVNLQPASGGKVWEDPGYMSILGIFPKETGKSCVGEPLNSTSCAAWRSIDLGPYWVSDVGVPGEPAVTNCYKCSMYYDWKSDGTINKYVALPFNGFTSHRFICEVGDKLP
jgi:cysteine-rich repeat protein